MDNGEKTFAVITGASTGIGYELAKCCGQHGMDMAIVANEPDIYEAANDFRRFGVSVEAVEAELATLEGVERLYGALNGRPVDVLIANAGRGLGGAFLDQNFDEVRYVIDTNITGTLYLIQRIAREMCSRNSGRILITGSIAGLMPGSFHAVYNGTKSFLDSFSFALRNELKNSEITVTCLMPGPTETAFFERARMTDTPVAQGEKDDAAAVARQGFEAMLRGDADVVTGWKNKIQAAMARIMPAGVTAEMHRRKSQPERYGRRTRGPE